MGIPACGSEAAECGGREAEGGRGEGNKAEKTRKPRREEAEDPQGGEQGGRGSGREGTTATDAPRSPPTCNVGTKRLLDLYTIVQFWINSGPSSRADAFGVSTLTDSLLKGVLLVKFAEAECTLL